MDFTPKYNHESVDGWWYTEGMKPFHLPALPLMPTKALDQLYRTTKDPRRRTRAQMVLLAAEQGLKVPQIAAIVREREAPVWRWRKRYRAEGLEGLQDVPRAAVRRRPRSLGRPFSLWTLPRLVDDLAEPPRIRVSDETVRRVWKHAGMGLSRPQQQISSPDPDDHVKKRRLKTPVTS
jgi:transposase